MISRNLVEDIVNGFGSGVITRCVVAPLDVLKIRFQVDETKYKGIFPAVQDIWKVEGLKGYWKGNTAGILLYFPWASLYWPIYRAGKRQLGFSTDEKCPPWASCASAANAGCIATVLTYPLDLLRTRLAVQTDYQWYSGIADGLKETLRKEGLSGVYRGLGASLYCVIPLMSIQMTAHDFICPLLIQTGFISSISASFWSGFCSGIIAKGFIFPLDVAKKCMQVQGGSFMNHNDPHSSTLRCLETLLREEGVTRLWFGFKPALLKAGMTASMSIGIFDLLTRVGHTLRSVKD